MGSGTSFPLLPPLPLCGDIRAPVRKIFIIFGGIAGVSNNIRILEIAQNEAVAGKASGKPLAPPEPLRTSLDTLATGVIPSSSSDLGKRTPWGIPIADRWDATDPVFQRHPMECGCFRDGILRCGVPCVWAWPPGAKIGDKALPLARGNR